MFQSWILATSAVALVSCSTLGKVGKGSADFVRKTASATSSQVSALSDKASATLNPAGVKVVEVREKDLKELPTGRDRALAYEKNRQKGLWFFSGPVDFIEPELPPPAVGEEQVNILLPPAGN